MTRAVDEIRIQPAAPAIDELSSGFHRGYGPLPHDFPISFGKDGQVESRFMDCTWNFSAWAGKPLVLNFGDGPQRKKQPKITPENAAILRQIAAWFLFGPRPVRVASSLKAKFKLIRPIFVHCSAQGIVASDLYRHSAVIESLGAQYSPSRFDELISILHALYEQREKFGFFILDPSGIARLSACTTAHQERQTPYIPPRIWSYVVNRCREFIDDHLAHMPALEACFKYCLDRYAEGAGSIQAACAGDIEKKNRPFGPSDPDGRFVDVCTRFGIKELLEKWVIEEGKQLDESELGIRALSLYLGMTGYVGTMYIAALSLMRIEEAWKLKCDCLKVHKDLDFGDVYLIQGETTKTVNDPAAVWVTAQSTIDAVKMMSSVAHLRMVVAAAHPDVPVTDEYLKNPYLVPRPYEPWTTHKAMESDLSIRQTPLSLAAVVSMYPRLLDRQQMTILQEDLNVARRINPTLDNDLYCVGSVWHLSWHQFRRTGAVNMFASGVVSDFALQHQLKHTTLQMTHYYGQGFSSLVLDESTRVEIVRTMYEMAARDAGDLFGEDFVSPYGVDRKDQALAPISGKEVSELRKLAKKGAIPWRETPFGGCTKAGPCEFGGFDNMIHCGGGDGNPPCAHGIFDRAKRPAVLELSRRINVQLIDVPDKGPLRDWLTETLAALSRIAMVTEEETQK